MRLEALTNDDRAAMLAEMPKVWTLRMLPVFDADGERNVGLILRETPVAVRPIEGDDGALEFEFGKHDVPLLDFVAETPRGWLGTALDVPCAEQEACDYLQEHRALQVEMAARIASGEGCD